MIWLMKTFAKWIPDYVTVHCSNNITCSLMYSFSFFFISCICCVRTCFSKKINESGVMDFGQKQRKKKKKKKVYFLERRRGKGAMISISHLITHDHSLKFITFLLQLFNLSLQSCSIFSLLITIKELQRLTDPTSFKEVIHGGNTMNQPFGLKWLALDLLKLIVPQAFQPWPLILIYQTAIYNNTTALSTKNVPSITSSK